MNVMFVNMGADNECVSSFRQRHSEVIADLVRQFRGDLPWLEGLPQMIGCLLYTSDAADDLLCVDLGGRRIIKKKKKL